MSVANYCARAVNSFLLIPLCLSLATGLLSQYAHADAAQAAAQAIAAAHAIAITESEVVADEGSADELYHDEGEFSAASEDGGEGEYIDQDISAYSDDPIRAEASIDFVDQMQLNYLTIHAKEYLVVLHDLVINRSNCQYQLSGRTDAPFPVNIKFGNGAKYLITCSTVLELTVRSNFGEHTYQFNQEAKHRAARFLALPLFSAPVQRSHNPHREL